MKKNGIVAGIITLLFIGLWFLHDMQNKIRTGEQEKRVLYQKTLELEEKLTVAQDKLKKETFVNSLFYKRLQPVHVQDSDMYLTPNSRASLYFTPRAGDKMYDAGWDYKKCDLLENEQDYILMRCQTPTSKDKDAFSEYYRFRITPCDSKHTFLECLYKVTEDSASKIEHLSNTFLNHYVIR